MNPVGWTMHRGVKWSAFGVAVYRANHLIAVVYFTFMYHHEKCCCLDPERRKLRSGE
jgi:hypothetical protein